MDRISALRNVEAALASFEAGELSLEELEGRVRGIVRTYATEFEGELRAYRATGDVEVTVLADSRTAARHRVQALVDGDPDFECERV